MSTGISPGPLLEQPHENTTAHWMSGRQSEHRRGQCSQVFAFMHNQLDPESARPVVIGYMLTVYPEVKSRLTHL